MAKNDTVLVDGIIEDRLKQKVPSDEKSEVFEYFSFEQILKNYDLSPEEIDSGWVDGRDDGGIDGFFIFINGTILVDPENFIWPKKGGEISVHIITCKHHSTFEQAPLDNLVSTLVELTDFSLDSKSFKGSYSEELLQKREMLLYAYKKLATTLQSLEFNFAYASRGDTNFVGESIQARAKQAQATVSEQFSSCRTVYRFIGARELIDMNRRTKNFSLVLPFTEVMTEGTNSVGLVRLTDYFKFITDETGNLKRYLFEANVRDFLGPNRVNEDIAKSLGEKKPSTNFWWLNNGITILASKAVAVGKELQVDDVQIVNGLQTSETIFRHFSVEQKSEDSRAVIVKVITSNDKLIRDKIIQATNNQSTVELASLHSTDRIQHDIEEVLEKAGWYYERRNNYYRNIGKPAEKIVTPLYVAAASIAILLKNPSQSVKVRAKFMRNNTSYNTVFSESFPTNVWPKAVSIFKIVDLFLEEKRLKAKRAERFVATHRGLLALLAVSKIIGKFNYSFESLTNMDLKMIDNNLLEELLRFIVEEKEIARRHNDTKEGHAMSAEPRNPNFVARCCKRFAEKYQIDAYQIVGKNAISNISTSDRKSWHKDDEDEEILDSAFLDEVDKRLPNQPWSNGVHRIVAKDLGCKTSKISLAIKQLILDGRRLKQIDGFVFDSDGKIVATRM
jgi:hypothetical protein